jgi:predicted dehydrogenase
MSDAIRAGIVGTQFMGRAHSNAYQRVGTFFPITPPVLRVACDVEPTGHIIGWEHTFIHEIGDLLTAISKGQEVHPDFHDGWRCQQVLDAASQSAAEQRRVQVKSDM